MTMQARLPSCKELITMWHGALQIRMPAEATRLEWMQGVSYGSAMEYMQRMEYRGHAGAIVSL